mmetsp:Transcript_1028/g.2440  ORF Transcript_1028/g.2440 Transcript_1028/m.2440 type:complete len:282 (-) Transcript_1028:1131-1976(-)|eukprot:CAMPEP_0178654244 /NCGR_PEP_ID=MMETSP0698-20121128/23650_1 /TAXON_ID=265572 /ORGANISM="Extubocellulus spinifer, Strain CCMP396" /LENGTH=281 /DNA_ID=CAMNT_0020296145 /DNA_START=276 /DNA_END=1121 /DNA_ORIENTATION=-
MVTKEGNRQLTYTLELVDASTKAAFAEHGSRDGMTTYAEVEPGAEYFVRADVRDQYGRVPKLLVDLVVDGTRIRRGYNLWKKPAGQCYLGFSSMFDGIKTVTALKFEKVTGTRGASSPAGNAVGGLPPSIGQVSLEFHEAVKKNGPQRTKRDTRQEWSGRSVAADSHAAGKKVIKSASGTIVQSMKEAKPCTSRYKRGKFIDSIQLKYCTAQGLLSAGIFPTAPSQQEQGEVIDLTDAPEPESAPSSSAKRSSSEGGDASSNDGKKRAKLDSGGVVDLTDD